MCVDWARQITKTCKKRTRRSPTESSPSTLLPELPDSPFGDSPKFFATTLLRRLSGRNRYFRNTRRGDSKVFDGKKTWDVGKTYLSSGRVAFIKIISAPMKLPYVIHGPREKEKWEHITGF